MDRDRSSHVHLGQRVHRSAQSQRGWVEKVVKIFSPPHPPWAHKDRRNRETLESEGYPERSRFRGSHIAGVESCPLSCQGMSNAFADRRRSARTVGPSAASSSWQSVRPTLGYASRGPRLQRARIGSGGSPAPPRALILGGSPGGGPGGPQKVLPATPLRCKARGGWGGSAHCPDPTAQSAPPSPPRGRRASGPTAVTLAPVAVATPPSRGVPVRLHATAGPTTRRFASPSRGVRHRHVIARCAR